MSAQVAGLRGLPRHPDPDPVILHQQRRVTVSRPSAEVTSRGGYAEGRLVLSDSGPDQQWLTFGSVARLDDFAEVLAYLRSRMIAAGMEEPEQGEVDR